MKYDFSNKTILITGGTGALGRNLLKSFLFQNPKTIIVTYRNEKEMQDLKTDLFKTNDYSSENVSTIIDFIKIDISKDNDIKKLISYISEKYGQIHILINVVGGYIGGKSILEITESEWDKMIDINLKSAFLISKNVIPVMVTNRYGKLVHISSRSGIKAQGNDAAYASSKAALIRFIESVSEDVKDYNININCVLPTIIDTEANRKAMPNADYSRWVKPEDLSNVILFLCSDDSKIINGSAIPTYGLL